MSVSPTLATESPGTPELPPPPQAATTSAMTTKKAPSAGNRSLLLTRIARLAMGFTHSPHFQELFRRATRAASHRGSPRFILLWRGARDQRVAGRGRSEPWWPEDRAWVVASDIDLPSTYVAGSAELAERLMGDGRLEALRVELGSPISLDPGAAGRSR